MLRHLEHGQQGRPQEPERTPDGREIIRSRSGAFTIRPDGAFSSNETPEELERRVFRRRELRVAAMDWSP